VALPVWAEDVVVVVVAALAVDGGDRYSEEKYDIQII
jgi:hypothetical protein